MRDTVLALLISTSLGFGLQQTALAADMPVKAPVRKAPMVAPVYDWSGFYVGAHIGGAWSNSTLTNSNIGTSWDPGGTGFIGGFQAGYNFQAGNFLFGVEGDFDWTTLAGTSGPGCHPAGHSPGFREQQLDQYGRCPLRHHLGPIIGLWQDWWRLGPFQRRAERRQRRRDLDRLPHGWRLAGRSGHGVCVRVELDRQARVQLYRAEQRDYFYATNIVNVRHDIQMLKVGANYQFGDRVPAAAPAPQADQGNTTPDRWLLRRKTPSRT